MTDKERRFIEEFVVDSNGTKAAIRAGYSAGRASQTAYELRQKPEIAAAIAERFKALTMAADEAAKHISDIGLTRVNDYLISRKTLKTPFVRKGLQQLINELDNEMEFEAEFARIAGLKGDALKDHEAQQRNRELQGIRYALELERNPSAYRDVPGESVYEDVVEVDLLALSRAKDKGRIKKLSFNERGFPTVEMYDAHAALRDILQMNGKLVQKHEHSGEFVPVDTGNLSPDERQSLVELALKVIK